MSVRHWQHGRKDTEQKWENKVLESREYDHISTPAGVVTQWVRRTGPERAIFWCDRSYGGGRVGWIVSVRCTPNPEQKMVYIRWLLYFVRPAGWVDIRDRRTHMLKGSGMAICYLILTTWGVQLGKSKPDGHSGCEYVLGKDGGQNSERLSIRTTNGKESKVFSMSVIEEVSGHINAKITKTEVKPPYANVMKIPIAYRLTTIDE